MVTKRIGIRREIFNDYRCCVFGREVEMITFSTACQYSIVHNSKPVELAFYDKNLNPTLTETGISQEVLNDILTQLG